MHIRYLFILVLFMFGLTACSEKKGFNYNYEGNFIAEKGGTLIDAMSGEPSNLISMIAGDSASSAISANIFNKLIKYDKNLELAPELADKWAISDDQKTITLKDNISYDKENDINTVSLIESLSIGQHIIKIKFNGEYASIIIISIIPTVLLENNSRHCN